MPPTTIPTSQSTIRAFASLAARTARAESPTRTSSWPGISRRRPARPARGEAIIRGHWPAMRHTLDTDFFTPPRPRVFAHRGDSGAYPENTMESFRAAGEAGAPYIELDVRMTRDGEIV